MSTIVNKEKATLKDKTLKKQKFNSAGVLPSLPDEYANDLTKMVDFAKEQMDECIRKFEKGRYERLKDIYPEMKP